MKKLFLFSLLLSFLITNLNAQDVKESSRSMSQGNNNALMIEIPGLSEKVVSDIWKKFLKDFYDTKTKWDRKTKEFLNDDADIAALGNGNSVDIYAVTEGKGDQVLLVMWVDLGGAYLSSSEHEDRYEEAERILMRFALEAAREKIKMDIKAEEKNLKKMEGDLDKMKNQKERFEKTIEKAQETIRKAEEDIVNNEKQQENQVKTIEDQKKLIEQIQKKLNDL